MDKTYDPKAIENQAYQLWQDHDVFTPGADTKAANYCIALPPPNVTGSLHMGHGFQDTLMDVLIRYHRMLGENTLWQPGTDHAGIATQMVVERLLNKDGLTRHDLGRDKFIEKIWQWKQQSGDRIIEQMRRLGSSCDWSRTRFTMDENLSRATGQAFIKLYNDGLIYRGERLVNWDPTLQSALSDLEVLNTEEQGSLWHINYPITNSDKFLTIATTRPETMLGDTAIAVHPDDTRYQHLISQTIDLPLTERRIPIIADEYVDMEFGTGVVKITPAHDFNDYEVGKRHQLPLINILTKEAKINTNAPQKYQGLDRFAARAQIIADLETQKLLVKTEPHALKIPKGDRSGVIIEPYLTKQWYVKIEPLAAPARAAVKSGRIKLIPENAANLYFEWMNNIQDWCISRQLWWGHRIPAWYDTDGKVYVGETEAEIRKHHKLADTIELQQDADVLDTWFSSGLWPFASLGWPEATPELKQFYPTSVLVTGFDIIFFWVARMIMFGIYFMDEVPFKEVYLHGLIRDHRGQKMSKSKGNVIDPVDLIDGIELDELIEKRTSTLMQEHLKSEIVKATKEEFPDGINAFGTDALRFTYCALASNSRNINFDIKRLEGYRNFCNKLWNASRYVLMQNPGSRGQATGRQNHPSPSGLTAGSSNIADQWIMSRLQQTILSCRKDIANYRFDHLAKTLYEFVWSEYCGWYLEFSKVVLNSDAATEAEKNQTRATLLQVLSDILKLLHPITPFITETIWQSLPNKGKTILAMATMPTSDSKLINPEIEKSISWAQQTITGIRNIRSEMNIIPSKKIPLIIKSATTKEQAMLEQLIDIIRFMARIDTIEYADAKQQLPATASCFVGELELHIPLAGLIDIEAETARINKNIKDSETEIARLSGKLGNANFVSKAPETVVVKEQIKLAAAKLALAQFKEQLEQLGKA